LPAWPYPPRASQSTSFRAGWEDTLELLDREISMLGGDDLVIGIVCEPSQISISGALKAGHRVEVQHPGAEVSFTAGEGRMTFHTDAFPHLAWNLRAIALGLEALGRVDRYGITSGGEQYAGFAQLGTGGPDPARGKALVELAGSLKEALRKHHPDHGGKDRDFVDVQAYRKAVGL
jgi:hypothetical protein